MASRALCSNSNTAAGSLMLQTKLFSVIFVTQPKPIAKEKGLGEAIGLAFQELSFSSVRKIT